MRTRFLLFVFSLFACSYSLQAQCADKFEVTSENFTLFCGQSGSGGFPITVMALGNDSITLQNVMSLGDLFKAELFCAADSFQIHRQRSNGREIDARCWRQSGTIIMSITEYDTASGSVYQSCSGTYAAPAVSINDPLERDKFGIIGPNPMTDRARLTLSEEVSDPASWSLELFDIRGSVVRSIPSLEGHNIEIPRSSLQSGVYLYRLSGPENQHQSGKLLVR